MEYIFCQPLTLRILGFGQPQLRINVLVDRCGRLRKLALRSQRILDYSILQLSVGTN